MTISDNLKKIKADIPQDVRLVCVSKFHPNETILEAYQCGERHFGESRAQELLQKQSSLPKDIYWHFIGPLQTNKVKHVVPIASLIHSVDSEKLLNAIEKEAAKLNMTSHVLLEVYIAQEEHKKGFKPEELILFFDEQRWKAYPHIQIDGLMCIASLTEDTELLKTEFTTMKTLFDAIRKRFDNDYFKELSMGMSNDFNLAILHGSTMVRIGSSIFGNRNYKQ